MNTEYVAMLGNGGYYEFSAESNGDAIKELDRRFNDMSWRLYEIDGSTGKVGTNVIASHDGINKRVSQYLEQVSISR